MLDARLLEFFLERTVGHPADPTRRSIDAVAREDIKARTHSHSSPHSLRAGHATAAAAAGTEAIRPDLQLTCHYR